jgi:hypothetical protein
MKEKAKKEELIEKEPLNPSGSVQNENLPSVDLVARAISRLENESQSKPSLDLSPIGLQLQEDLASNGICHSDEEIERISKIT